MLRTSFHLLLLSNLMAAGNAGELLAESATPREKACHAEATKLYIEDFRRLGSVREEAHENVMAFVNDRSKYERYYASCLSRWNSIPVR
jgi:hypothetical protein